jgi:hypothetical protein
MKIEVMEDKKAEVSEVSPHKIVSRAESLILLTNYSRPRFRIRSAQVVLERGNANRQSL